MSNVTEPYCTFYVSAYEYQNPREPCDLSGCREKESDQVSPEKTEGVPNQTSESNSFKYESFMRAM